MFGDYRSRLQGESGKFSFVFYLNIRSNLQATRVKQYPQKLLENQVTTSSY